MSHTYGDYEDWEEEGKDSPLALVGLLVMVLTSAAIIGNALFMQKKSAELEMITEASKSGVANSIKSEGLRSDEPERQKSSIAPGGDATILAVQAQLNKAGYYVGPQDGVNGSQTREAVRAFEDAIGVPPTGKISRDLYEVLMGRISVDTYRERHAHNLPIKPDNDLIQSPQGMQKPVVMLAVLPKAKPHFKPKRQKIALRSSQTTAPKRVSTISIRNVIENTPVPPASIPNVEPDPTLARIQNALARIGYGNLAIDGLMGTKTSAAIAEFQRVRGHPVTGAVNDRLINDLIMMGYLSRG